MDFVSSLFHRPLCCGRCSRLLKIAVLLMMGKERLTSFTKFTSNDALNFHGHSSSLPTTNNFRSFFFAIKSDCCRRIGSRLLDLMPYIYRRYLLDIQFQFKLITIAIFIICLSLPIARHSLEASIRIIARVHASIRAKF